MRTLVISAFPGTGKSYLFQNKGYKKILEAESSDFDKANFPKNYISFIRKNLGKQSIILTSSHKDVRDGMIDANINYTLVYPKKELKKEYISRYIDRGDSDEFIENMDKKWNEYIVSCMNQKFCIHKSLDSGMYLTDIL